MAMRVIMQEIQSRVIVSRDLETQGLKVTRKLSAPCEIEFTIPYQGPNTGQVAPRNWGHFIHVEEEFPVAPYRRIIATGIVDPSTVMADNGDLQVKAKGFTGYANGIPWLQNWNPITVDPYHVVRKIWDHIQSYSNGNMNVNITPADSGTFMLPGWSWNGARLNIEFFAVFQRMADMRDCGEFIDNLARDIPFDYREVSTWNADRTDIQLTMELGYPRLGGAKQGMVFRQGENVIQMKPKAEVEIQWASDVIVKGWMPGKVYSSQFTNPAADRLRRVIKEGDMSVNSKERALVWAKRRLTRRQVPAYWEGLVVDAEHPNAPFGQWDVGDDIKVEGRMPWNQNSDSKVSLEHKVMGYQWDGTGNLNLNLRALGAFNYDPIMYETSEDPWTNMTDELIGLFA